MTWSILVRDAETGALGAAVASKFFAVGALCIHVEGGVAALATQAMVNPMYAVDAMPRLRAGGDPAVVLGDLVVPDPGSAQRQLHILDARGRLAQHTGAECITWAGHVAGQDVSVAGNMLAGPEVVEATLHAFLAATGSVTERLLTAMEAGEAAGGDKRGKQSAALKVCTARSRSPTWTSAPTTTRTRWPNCAGCAAVSQERFALFRRFMAGTRQPDAACSTARVIDQAIAQDAAAKG